MGTEYSTIFINESSQITYDTFQMLKTRLNAPKDCVINLKFILDTNPRAPSHWIHRVFIEGRVPEDMSLLPRRELYTRLFWKPEDNVANLSKDYIENNLDTLTGVKKRRLRDGVWCDSGSGTVYRFKRDINHVSSPLNYRSEYETWCSLDFGVSDPTAIIWYQILQLPMSKDNKKGLEIRIIDEYQNNNQPVEHYAEILKSKNYRNVNYCGDPSGVARGQSLDSWISKFREHGIRINTKPKYSNKVEEVIDHANDYMPYVRINEIQTPKTTEMFENWARQRDKDDRVIPGSKPLHDIYSHLGTSFYYFCINRFPIKKSGQVYIY